MIYNKLMHALNYEAPPCKGTVSELPIITDWIPNTFKSLYFIRKVKNTSLYYVYERFAGIVYMFVITSSGDLVRAGPPYTVSTNAQDMIVSEDSKFLYFVYDNNNRIDVYSISQNNVSMGELIYSSQVTLDTMNGQPSYGGNTRICVSPNGLNVYATNNFGTQTFARNVTNGGLSKTSVTNIGNGADKIQVSPDGLNVYVAVGSNSVQSSRLINFSRNPVSGALTYKTYINVPYCRSVVVSPDSRHVYATTNTGNAIYSFFKNENGDLGSLSILNVGMTTQEINISSDGLSVYVLSQEPDTTNSYQNLLLTFSRKTISGLLTLESTNVINSLTNYSRFEISEDDRFIYVLNNNARIQRFFRCTPTLLYQKWSRPLSIKITINGILAADLKFLEESNQYNLLSFRTPTVMYQGIPLTCYMYYNNDPYNTGNGIGYLNLPQAVFVQNYEGGSSSWIIIKSNYIGSLTNASNGVQKEVPFSFSYLGKTYSYIVTWSYPLPAER